ncbi:MAG TPA: NAD(P)/FAD-dependent oxidoreductase [Thermodesulfobacteriota bacterium]|nr:NAD(P)/FAD-dependent oxidoreductase [Thermodesulfobacteriota bacterium]
MGEAPLAGPYDIVVIGAGPAGSSAAQAAAQRGAKVLLIDRRQRLGIPVQCAEFVPQWISRQASFSPACIMQRVEKMVIHLPGPITYEMKSPGYMLDRSLFDKELAASAVLSGVRISIESKAIGLSTKGLIVERSSKEETIPSKVFIGADGASSAVARFVGRNPLRTLAALQYEVVLSEPQNHVDVYFHKDYEGGYGWFFPKGKTANVGIGVVSSKASRLPDLLEHFLDILRGSRKLQEIQIVSRTGGLIPCESDQRRLFKNVLLVGDAAGHAHPITGAGIFNAVMAGLIAGRTAAKAVETEDLRYLAQYEIECQEAFGESLSYGTLKRKFLEENWNRPEVDFEELIRKTWVGFKEYYQDRRKIPLPSPLPSRKCAS